tara:strand:- start:1783 stop:2190 length:408 start_codon:yes stop_codon:yes gene_type:complete
MIIPIVSTIAIMGVIAFYAFKLNQRQEALSLEWANQPEEELSEFDQTIIGTEPEADFRLVDMGQDSKFRPFIVKMTPEQEWWYNQKSRTDKRKVKARCLAGKDPFPELAAMDRQARKDKKIYAAMDKAVEEAGLK